MPTTNVSHIFLVNLIVWASALYFTVFLLDVMLIRRRLMCEGGWFFFIAIYFNMILTCNFDVYLYFIRFMATFIFAGLLIIILPGAFN